MSVKISEDYKNTGTSTPLKACIDIADFIPALIFVRLISNNAKDRRNVCNMVTMIRLKSSKRLQYCNGDNAYDGLYVCNIVTMIRLGSSKRLLYNIHIRYTCSRSDANSFGTQYKQCKLFLTFIYYSFLEIV